jgi:hypothetical protein
MQPQSPNPDFDFMLKDQPQARRSLMPNIPRPAKIALIVAVGIILLIIVTSLFSSRGKGSTQSFVSLAARAQETLRVTALEQPKLQDPQTQALAATVSAALSSDEQQIISYLAQNHIKASKVQLAALTDKTTDASLQTAAQNNNLDSAYVSYLRDSLTRYQTDLQNANKSAGQNGQALLFAINQSAQTLLKTSPIKS